MGLIGPWCRSRAFAERACWRAQKAPCGRGNKSTIADDFGVSETRIKAARLVYQHCREMVPLVIDGSMGLDADYNEARQRKALSAAITSDRIP